MPAAARESREHDPLPARLFDSVPPEVKITSPERIPSTRATRARASSSALAAASPYV